MSVLPEHRVRPQRRMFRVFMVAWIILGAYWAFSALVHLASGEPATAQMAYCFAVLVMARVELLTQRLRESTVKVVTR